MTEVTTENTEKVLDTELTNTNTEKTEESPEAEVFIPHMLSEEYFAELTEEVEYLKKNISEAEVYAAIGKNKLAKMEQTAAGVRRELDKKKGVS
jgi:hypothetical protein